MKKTSTKLTAAIIQKAVETAITKPKQQIAPYSIAHRLRDAKVIEDDEIDAAERLIKRWLDAEVAAGRYRPSMSLRLKCYTRITPDLLALEEAEAAYVTSTRKRAGRLGLLLGDGASVTARGDTIEATLTAEAAERLIAVLEKLSGAPHSTVSDLTDDESEESP